MTHRGRTLGLMLLLAVVSLCAAAQQPERPRSTIAAVAAVPWSALSPAQQRLLAPLAARWADLSPARQRALARAAGVG